MSRRTLRSGGRSGASPRFPPGRGCDARRQPCPRDPPGGDAVMASPSDPLAGTGDAPQPQGTAGEMGKTEAAAQRLDRMVERLDALLESVERQGELSNPEV